MPFKFEIELSANGSKALWTRAIHSLSTISDTIKITIRHGSGYDENNRYCFNEISLTSVNKTKISQLNASFKDSYFRKFTVEGELPDDALEDDGENGAKCFSFLINSKNMDLLFKDCGEDAESWKLFIVYGNEMIYKVYSNKLFVEFQTKNEMTKKYSLNFNPGFPSFDMRYRYIYAQILDDQQLNDSNSNKNRDKDEAKDRDIHDEIIGHKNDERVHFLGIDSIILRKFLTMFPSTLEDFKVEIYPNVRRLLFSGFNRQNILGVRGAPTNYLTSQPMTLSVQISLNHIPAENILLTSHKEIDQKDSFHISFKLRNFKTFVQLISSQYFNFADKIEKGKERENNNNSDRGLIMSNNGLEKICELMFSGPGYPIVLERKYHSSRENEIIECCSITLVEITDSESNKIQLEHNESVKKVNLQQIHSTAYRAVPTENNYDELLFIPDNEDIQNVVDSGNNKSMKILQNVLREEKEKEKKKEKKGEKENENGSIVDNTKEGVNKVDKIYNYENEIENSYNRSNVNFGVGIESDNRIENFGSIFWDNKKFHNINVISKPTKMVPEMRHKEHIDRNHNDDNDNDDDNDDNYDDNYDDNDDDNDDTDGNGEVDGDEVDEGDEYLGPTQNISKTKGIFD